MTKASRGPGLVVVLACATLCGCAKKQAEPKPRDASLYNEPRPASTAPDHRDDEAAMLAAQVRITTAMAQAIRVGAAVWQTANPGCPKASEVVAAHLVPDAVRAEDAWDTPFRIVCGAKGPTVSSAGPDRAFDTKDDVAVGDR